MGRWSNALTDGIVARMIYPNIPRTPLSYLPYEASLSYLDALAIPHIFALLSTPKRLSTSSYSYPHLLDLFNKVGDMLLIVMGPIGMLASS